MRLKNVPKIRLDYLKQSLFSFVDLAYLNLPSNKTWSADALSPELDIARVDFYDFITDNYPQEWEIRQALIWTLNLNKADWTKVYQYLEVPWPANNEAAVRIFLESLWDHTFSSWKNRNITEGQLLENYQSQWLETLAGEAGPFINDLHDKIVIPASLEDIPLTKLAQCLKDLESLIPDFNDVRNRALYSVLEKINYYNQETGCIFHSLRWLLNQNDDVILTILSEMDINVQNNTFSIETLRSLWTLAFKDWKIENFVISHFKVIPETNGVRVN
ncbi:MAG: hypothetical protein RPR97_15440 [Colwellia sp.]